MNKVLFPKGYYYSIPYTKLGRHVQYDFSQIPVSSRFPSLRNASNGHMARCAIRMKCTIPISLLRIQAGTRICKKNSSRENPWFPGNPTRFSRFFRGDLPNGAFWLFGEHLDWCGWGREGSGRNIGAVRIFEGDDRPGFGQYVWLEAGLAGLPWPVPAESLEGTAGRPGGRSVGTKPGWQPQVSRMGLAEGRCRPEKRKGRNPSGLRPFRLLLCYRGPGIRPRLDAS